MGPGWRRHPPGGGDSRSTGREGGTGEASSSGSRRLAVHLEGGRDRGDVVILSAAEARGPPGGRAGAEIRYPFGGGGSRSTGREGGTGEGGSGESLSFWRRRIAVHREGRWDRESVILRAAEARGPPGGRAGPGRRHPPGGGGSRSTGREGWTGKASSSERRRLAVHQVGGRDRNGVILRAAEERGQPGGRAVKGRRRHPPGGGSSRSTGREGGTGEASSFWRRRLAVHREGGRDREGVILRAAEALGPPGGRAGPGRRHPPGCGGTRSTGREGGIEEASSFFGRRRLAVHREGGRDRGGGGSRYTGKEGATGEASSSSGQRRLAVHGEGGRDRGGVVILRAAEARGPPLGMARPGRRRHPPGGGG